MSSIHMMSVMGAWGADMITISYRKKPRRKPQYGERRTKNGKEQEYRQRYSKTQKAYLVSNGRPRMAWHDIIRDADGKVIDYVAKDR